MIKQTSTILTLLLMFTGAAFAETEIFTSKVNGDAYTPGEIFDFVIGIRGNEDLPVMSYAFRILYNAEAYQLKQAVDVELKAIATSMGPVEGEGFETWQDVLTLGNIGNKKKNLSLCRLVFEVIAKPAGDQRIIVSGDPGNVDVVSVAFTQIDVQYKNQKTDPVPHLPKRTPPPE